MNRIVKKLSEWAIKACPKCGTPNPDSFNMCFNCGSAL